MRSREYWKQRAIAAEYYAQQDASLTIGKIQELYGNALEHIDEEVQKLRRELGKQTGAVSEDELDELLSASESDKSYRELQNLLDVAKTDEERADILSRMNSQAYGARIKRIDSVGNKILAEFTKVASMEKVLCKDLFSDTYQKGYYGKIYELAKGYNAGVAFDVLPKRAINKALSEPWHGENYSARIWKHSQAFTEQIQQTVVKGLMTGQSRAKLASELMEHTDSTRYVAERLVRTETAHFLSEGQREAYEAAGIEKYRYLAALSERTCEVCASLDNKVFPLDEATEGVNYPTMHPNCRCVTITADAKLSTRLAKNPVTGENYKVDGNMDFA
ncbi:MAG: minor capsid protein, partial [Clostridia bacterium]|nr:minor capsid protein [Clostridia bacterium]